jgi:hypothetical protein
MTDLTTEQTQYLASQRLGRLATAGADHKPHVGHADRARALIGGTRHLVRAATSEAKPSRYPLLSEPLKAGAARDAPSWFTWNSRLAYS